MLSESQLSQLRKELVIRQQEIEDQFVQNASFGLIQGGEHDSVGELSSYDNHPADTATETYEREKDIALNGHAEQELKEIKEALQSMADGMYGRCRECGEEIPFERLQAIPTTQYCKEHSPSQDTSHNLPVEQEVAYPPFGQYDYDEKDANLYDAEDSWQDVARYGTSETPSDFMDDRENYGETYIEGEQRIGYVEDYENFAATDLYGNSVTVYPSKAHNEYEDVLDEEGIMTAFGDLPGYEKDPYTEEYIENKRNE